jgi:hypothetical protein
MPVQLRFKRVQVTLLHRLDQGTVVPVNGRMDVSIHRHFLFHSAAAEFCYKNPNLFS